MISLSFFIKTGSNFEVMTILETNIILQQENEVLRQEIQLLRNPSKKKKKGVRIVGATTGQQAYEEAQKRKEKEEAEAKERVLRAERREREKEDRKEKENTRRMHLVEKKDSEKTMH